MKKIEIGERFGRLTVLRETTKEERLNKAGRNYWCRCDCGNEVIVYGHNLKTGNTKSCGCLNKELSSKRNSIEIPIGTKFGFLTVIERMPVDGSNKAKWKCLCDCGKEIIVSGTDLRSGKVISCGCKLRPNIIDETNHRYGKLLVLGYAGSRESSSGALWKCLCDCGKECFVRGDELRRGRQSCGCIKSYKEEEISNLLDRYDIEYSRQYTFKDLKSQKNKPLRFDFAIFKNHQLFLLIEYQGEQHYDINSDWYSEEAVKRDELKKEYCKQHNIKLIELNKTSDLEDFVMQLEKEVNS